MAKPTSGWEYEGDLSILFPINEDGSSRRQTPLTDADFDRISEILEHNGKQEWSKVVRTYSVLRMAQALHYLDGLIKDDGIVDGSIPYTHDNLPPRLSPAVRARFLEAQKLVMTELMDLEHGRHLQIESFAEARLDIVRPLGKGGCGQVYQAYSKLNQRTYAVKLLQRGKTFGKDQTSMRNFLSEISTSKKVKHYHVVKVIGSFTEKVYVGIIMGTVADCDLEAFMLGEMDQDKKILLRSFFGCLVSGLKAIHEEGIRHKDIKPKNILVKGSEVMYTDFGIALDYSQTDVSISTGRPAMFTPQYSAPEVVAWGERGSPSDIFSLATVFLEMTTRLNGKSISELHNFLRGEQEHNVSWYCKCLPGIQQWVTRLQNINEGEDEDNIPFIWVLQGLEQRMEARPTVYQLWDLVDRAAEASAYPLACHKCTWQWNERAIGSGLDTRLALLGEDWRETNPQTSTTMETASRPSSGHDTSTQPETSRDYASGQSVMRPKPSQMQLLDNERKGRAPGRQQNTVLLTNTGGTSFLIPYENCTKWADMAEIMHAAEKHSNRAARLQDITGGKYDIIGPGNQIILNSHWERFVEPGLQVALKLRVEDPIRFKDAVGRKFSFPFYLCETWQVT